MSDLERKKGGQGELNKDIFLGEQYKSQGRVKKTTRLREGRRGAIDPQSQSSGFHVSRCQVSAIGLA